MNIKEASLLTGISRDMLRYYEKLGILSPGRNKKNGYRDYSIMDLNNAVMIKQYSSLGLSLHTLANFSRHGGITGALEQFRQAIDRLETDLELTRNRLENIRDYYHLFDMLRHGKISETGYAPLMYYYRRSQEHPFFDDLSPALYGAVRMVFRIENKNVRSESYPPGQGFLSLQQIPSQSLPFIEIPAHHFWRTVMEEERDGFMNREKLLPVLEQMENEGYHLQGDIFLSQILCANEQTPNKLICIECDIG